ncbi:MAG: RusA family crossover junction endodeoxyribonuclease [Actinobacteria bacterium]|nr:RusA family crossover junction endodeoxyribonuclease [Actinomycetota bacterium]
MEITLRVYGDPAPQGSKRIVRGNRLIEAAGEKLKRWRRAIAEECHNARQDNPEVFFTDAVFVHVRFYLPRPKTVSESKRPKPIVPPDVDKLARGLLDGIGQSEVIWGDDSQVVKLLAEKMYSTAEEAGAVVYISNITD